VDVPEFGEAPVGFGDGDRYLVDPVHSLEHAGLAEQLGSFIQEL